MRNKKRYVSVQLAAAALVAAFYIGAKVALPASKAAAAGDTTLYTVERVIDGDTLKLSGGNSVRLIGVDTPEVHYSDKLVRDAARTHQDIKTIQTLGRQASAFTKELCLGKSVRMEFDVEKRDKYRRLLAYVYLEDGTFVNAKIMAEGYGQVMTIPPNVKHADEFLKLQKEAREARKGLWK